jgi:hypothetical protein
VKLKPFRETLAHSHKYGYNGLAMEMVLITRNGKPVAQLVPPPQSRRTVVLGGMRDRIRLLPGWDDPVDLDRFLQGDL